MVKLKWPNKLVIIRHGEFQQNITLGPLDNNLKKNLKQQKRIRDFTITTDIEYHAKTFDI